jgi:fatty acid-binding protein DegV
MSRVEICTDSSSLLSRSAAASLHVQVVPVHVLLDGEPYDEVMSSLDWFYERMRSGAVATTAHPSPGQFEAAYADAAERGASTVVSIHLDATVSGVVSTAELAAQGAPIPVTVVDSRTVSYGVGRCVRAAAEVVARGGSGGDAVRAAQRCGGRMKNAFVARTGPGGRVPEETMWTVLRFEQGIAERLYECASVEEAIERMATLALQDAGPLEAAVGHAGAAIEGAADRLAHDLLGAEQVAQVERYRVGASIGAHTGPDSFGLFWWPTRQ